MTVDRFPNGLSKLVIGDMINDMVDAANQGQTPESRIFTHAAQFDIAPEDIVAASMRADLSESEPIFPYARMYGILTLEGTRSCDYETGKNYAERMSRRISERREQLDRLYGESHRNGNQRYDSMFRSLDTLDELFQEAYGHLLEDSQK